MAVELEGQVARYSTCEQPALFIVWVLVVSVPIEESRAVVDGMTLAGVHTKLPYGNLAQTPQCVNSCSSSHRLLLCCRLEDCGSVTCPGALVFSSY